MIYYQVSTSPNSFKIDESSTPSSKDKNSGTSGRLTAFLSSLSKTLTSDTPPENQGVYDAAFNAVNNIEKRVCSRLLFRFCALFWFSSAYEITLLIGQVKDELNKKKTRVQNEKKVENQENDLVETKKEIVISDKPILQDGVLVYKDIKIDSRSNLFKAAYLFFINSTVGAYITFEIPLDIGNSKEVENDDECINCLFINQKDEQVNSDKYTAEFECEGVTLQLNEEQPSYGFISNVENPEAKKNYLAFCVLDAFCLFSKALDSHPELEKTIFLKNYFNTHLSKAD